MPSPRDYGYRNRITVHVRDGEIGFFGVGEGSGERPLIDIAQCPIAEPAVNDALARFRARPWRREGHCTLRADPDRQGGGFRQTNDGAAAELLALVSGLLSSSAGETAGAAPPPLTHLIDAYCGAGFFSAALRERFERVIGLEWDARAVAQAQRNAAPNERYVCGDVAALLPDELAVAPADGTLLLVDPPSEGLPEPVRRAVLAGAPAEVIYVSCNPATLARDLSALRVRYELISVTPVDMFPQTAEIEAVAHLRRLG